MQFLEKFWSRLNGYIPTPHKLEDKHAIQCDQYFLLTDDVSVCLRKPIKIEDYPVQYVETYDQRFELVSKFSGPKTHEGVEIAGIIDETAILLKMKNHLYLYNLNPPILKKDFGDIQQQFILEKANQLLFTTNENKSFLYDLDDLETPAELPKFPQSIREIISLSKKNILVRHKQFGFQIWNIEVRNAIKTVDNFLVDFQAKYPNDWQAMIGYSEGTQVKLQTYSEGKFLASFNQGFLTYNFYTNAWDFAETNNLTPFKNVAYLPENVVLCVYEAKDNPLQIVMQLYNLTTKKIFKEMTTEVSEYVLDVTISKQGEVGFRTENFIQHIEFLPPHWQDLIEEDNKRVCLYFPKHADLTAVTKRDPSLMANRLFSPHDLKDAYYSKPKELNVCNKDEQQNTIKVIPKTNIEFSEEVREHQSAMHLRNL